MKSIVMDVYEELFLKYPKLKCCKKNIESAFLALTNCYKSGGKVLVCGNGGSAADSEHIVGELMKGFRLKRHIRNADIERIARLFPEDWEYLSGNLQSSLPAISLVSQSAILTAYANDIAADMAYAQQVYGYANEGDILIGLSTSGNSKNVVNAIKIAKAFGVLTIGLIGESDCTMKDICDIIIQAPETETYKVQEYHMPIYHALCAMVELEMYGIPEI